jgi:hypothetical protein
MLDPIADKLLVASCLLMLAADNTIHGWTLWAAIVILCREILVSGLREYLAALRVSVPVTRLAKWKTTLQLVAIGFLIAGEAGDRSCRSTTQIGIVLLWLSAMLTIYTGWDYFRAGCITSSRRMSVKLGISPGCASGSAWRRKTSSRRPRRTVDELIAWLAGAARLRLCLRDAAGDPRRDRSRHVKPDAHDRRRPRDRLLPADDRRLSSFARWH